MISLFKSGYKGLSDTLFSGQAGSVYRSVGIDHRSEPGKLKVHQKLTKDSGSTIDELCKASVNVSDGSKLWFSSESGKIWRESGGTYTLVYTLDIETFNLLTALDDSKSHDASTQDSQHKIAMKPDGAKMLTIGRADSDVHEYALSTEKDISTASFIDSTSVVSEVSSARDIFVRADGLKMYIASASAIFQYTLGTAWDASTRSYDSKTFDFSDVTTTIESISFKSDGSKVYILEADGTVYEIDLSTSWDISTASVPTFDSLVVAGGGGGSTAATSVGGGGGGGAGGMKSETLLANIRSYAITVGAGGLGGTGDTTVGNKGGDSSLDTLVVSEGGGFGSHSAVAAGDGGSGGGAYTGTVGSGVSGQGNDGGKQTSTNFGGGGGGGAGGAGASTSTDTGGSGGSGSSSSISGSPVTYATGGDGGSIGGGDGSNGAANTGDGGGGGGEPTPSDGGDGGSGIVIISYLTGTITATGGTITTSGGKTIHTFTSDGTFEITNTNEVKSFTKSEGSTSSNLALAFNDDGSKLFIGNSDFIYQYSLSTPWDVTSSTFADISLDVTDTATNGVLSIAFDGAGENLYISGTNLGTVYQYALADGTEESKGLSAAEFYTLDNDSDTNKSLHVVWTTEHYLFKIAVSDLTSWVGNVKVIERFTNGDDTYHPMEIVNEKLFIGDKIVVASVDSDATFTAETNLNIPETERITSLQKFDVDLLIGTKKINGGRVLRWDTEAESWSAEDDVYVKGGVSAFLQDDNYIYVLDKEGYIWFYNGEQNELYTRIPEVGNGEIKINANAVDYWRGVPIFGLSNESGNTVLQGVYGFGKYSRSYTTSLSLDFPVPSGEFSGVEIGTMEVDGHDLYVAWKDGQDVGVAKLDYTAKYASAYMETMALASSDIRHQLKTIIDAMVPYYSLPASTSITIGYKSTYEASFTDYTMQTDTKRQIVEAKTPSVPNVANPQLRVTFGVNNNDAPEIEDVLYDLNIDK